MAIESPRRQGTAAGLSGPSTPQTSTTFTASKLSTKRSRSEASEEEQDELEESSLSSLSEREDSYIPSRAPSYEGDDDKDGLFSSNESSAKSSAEPDRAQTPPSPAMASTLPTNAFFPRTRGPWDEKEDEILRECVRKVGKDWPAVAKAFAKACRTSSRTPGACSHRYRLLLDLVPQGSAAQAIPLRGPPSQASALSSREQASTSGQSSTPVKRPHQDRPPSLSLSPAKGPREHLDSRPASAQVPTAGQSTIPAVGVTVDHDAFDFDTASNADAAFGAETPAAPAPGTLSQDAPFFPRIPQLPPWAEEEDEVLYRCVRKENRNWPAVAIAFSREADDFPQRSAEALEARYTHLLEEHQKRLLAEQSQGSASHQQEVPQTPQPLQSHARLPAPSHSTPSRVLVRGDRAWDQAEEACLLSSAIRHQATKNVAVQVQAVVDDYNAAFPTSNRTIDSIHIKFRQLLQDHLEEQREVEAQAGSEARAGEKSGAEQGAGGVDFREKAEGEQDEAPRTAEHARVEHQQADAEQEADESLANPRPDAQRQIRRVRFADVEPCSSPNPSTSPDSPRKALPPAAVHVSFNDAHIYGNGTGFRFERMPRGSRIAILSPTYAKVYRREDEDRYQEEQETAAFIFTVLRDGLIEATRCPPHTTSYCVRVLEEGDEVMEMEDDAEGRGKEELEKEDNGGGGDVRSRVVGIETRYCGVDGFAIVFFAPV